VSIWKGTEVHGGNILVCKRLLELKGSKRNSSAPKTTTLHFLVGRLRRTKMYYRERERERE
jgi:hypothetical protein